MIVAHNLSALNGNRQLSIVTGKVSGNAEKLSSGYKINKAADDAAGLSISEKMRKQIRGLGQATENCEDGISMVQTADGALAEVHDMLQRMNELCVQAANGTNATSDRLDIQKEIDQLKTEIDRVSETTKFNEINLLDGSIAKPGSTANFLKAYNKRIAEVTKNMKKWNASQLVAINGKNAGQVVDIDDLANQSGINIIYVHDDVATIQSAAGNPTLTDSKYNNLKKILKEEIVPNAVKALTESYSPAFDFLNNSNIGIGLKLGGSSEIGTGVLAYVGMGWSENSNKEPVSDMLWYQLAVNYDSLNIDSIGNITDAKRNELEVTIVHEMMHAFMDEALTNGMIGVVDGKVTSDFNNGVDGDSFPKWFKEGMAQTAAGGYYNGNDFVNMGLGITGSTSIDDIKAKLNAEKIGGASDNSNYASGYLACMYLGYLAGGKSMTAGAFKDGLSDILFDLRDGVSLQNKIKDLTGYSTITEFENNFANDAASFVKNLTNFVGQGTGGVVGDLTKTDDILENTDANKAIGLFELNTVNDMVGNKYPGDYKVFVGGSKSNGKDVPDNSIDIGSIAALKKATGFGAALHIGADADMNNKLNVYIDAMDSQSIGVAEVDVRTDDFATISIERVALAISQVSAQRSRLGSYQNRLEHTVKNLDNIVENTTAAESLIRDTDMAKEMVEYSNNNVLLQAGQSMLSQANQKNQGVLSLLSA